MIIAACTKPTMMYGNDLAEHDLDRRDRHRQRVFHRPALDRASPRAR
jgi:hypothetical protein